MATCVPKIAAGVLERRRVHAWLERYAQTPVRYLAAPAGAGKTTAAVVYARSRSTKVGFVVLAPASPQGELIGAMCAALELPFSNAYADFIEGLQRIGSAELIVDDVDNADAAARELLGRIYLDVPDGIRFIFLARSETVVPLNGARVRGFAEVCDPALLAFDASEIEELAQSLGLPNDVRGASQLAQATGGWAIAVAGACRTAASERIRVSAALHDWLAVNAPAVAELINNVLDRTPAEIGSPFRRQLELGSAPARWMLEAFAQHGLFVCRQRRELAINPLLQCAAILRALPICTPQIAPAAIEMFGRFEMSIGGKPVRWIRRRDRQIVQFVAMQPDGKASREQIIATFWPDADRQLARQCLRTACSTIRRAIGRCAGRANVADYFVGDQIVTINVDRAVVSAHEFARHFALGEAAFQRGDRTAAIDAYRAAQDLCRSPLLAGEPPVEWADPYVKRFEEMACQVSARLVELRRHALLDYEPARQTLHAIDLVGA